MSVHNPGEHCILTLSCTDRPGIVQAIATFLVEHDCTIAASSQFGDPDRNAFFMRVDFTSADGQPLNAEALAADFALLGEELNMMWRLGDAAQPQRVLIMVSKYAHCLNDLLFRTAVGELNIEIVAVVSNHPDLGRLVDHGVSFRVVPVTPETKADAETTLLQIVSELDAELVVLARYMQILSDGLCRQLAGRTINIHHSMLPSFRGARPYHQAHTRGVKVIGATAHYVTSDLDEGPIIEQETLRVDHAMSADELEVRGRELEARTLARAVRWHTENRIALNGAKTVVFS